MKPNYFDICWTDDCNILYYDRWISNVGFIRMSKEEYVKAVEGE